MSTTAEFEENCLTNGAHLKAGLKMEPVCDDFLAGLSERSWDTHELDLLEA